MGQCKYCGKKGFFLSLSSNGLCKNCNPIIVSRITGSARIIQDCLTLVENSKKLDVRLGRRKLLLEHAELLLEFEKKNINTIEPLPSELIDQYTPLHDKIIVEVTETDLTNILIKAEKARTEKTRMKYVNNAISKLKSAKKIIDNKKKLIPLEEKINLFIETNKLKEALKTKQKKIPKSVNADIDEKMKEIARPIIEEFLERIDLIEYEEEIAKLSKSISSIKMKDKLPNSIIKKMTGCSSLKEIATLLNVDSESLVEPLKHFYITTYISDFRSQLSQKISDMEAEKKEWAIYWEYFGAVLDNKTRPICQTGLGVGYDSRFPNAPFFTDEEKKLFQSLGIRWECRHEFVEISENYYNEMVHG